MYRNDASNDSVTSASTEMRPGILRITSIAAKQAKAKKHCA